MRRIIYTLAALLFTCAINAQTTQILGAPGTKIVNRGDFQIDSILYIPRTQVTVRTPSQSGALRYQASDSSVYHWTGTAWRKSAGATIDSLLYATRAWRQKGIDSINAVNASGTGINGYITRWSGTKTMDTSQIFQSGATIGIGTNAPIDGVLDMYRSGTSIARLRSDIQGAYMSFQNNASGTTINDGLFVGYDNAAGYIYNNENSVLVFGNNAAERMRINSSGTLLINTTNDDNNVKLRVNGRVRAETIDSSASPINMLWADNDGIIKKAAVPSGGGSADSATFATRARVQKAVDSINLFNASGTGISGYMTRWSGAKTMDTSQLFQSASGGIGIGETSIGSNKLYVNGSTFLGGNIITNATSDFGLYFQQPKNALGMILVSKEDPLGADTIVAGIGLGSNTHQAPARITARTAQAWNATDRGIYMDFSVTPTTTTQNYVMLRIKDDGELIVAQQPFSDQGAFRLQVDGNGWFNGALTTAAPTDGTAKPWRLGAYVASAPTATGYVEVLVDGVKYKLLAATY